MAGRLEGKVAIVTGAGSDIGIGRASAILFAQEGAKVVCSDIDVKGGEKTVADIKKQGGQACFIKTDVSKEAEVKAMVDFAVKQYGKLNVLFNCAGIAIAQTARAPITEQDGMVTNIPEFIWDKIMGINLKGPFFGCKYAIPEMIKQNGGAIINVSSDAGVDAVPSNTTYNVSKAGIILLTKSVACDYGKQGIRCNCLIPGPTRTNLMKEALENPITVQMCTMKVFRGYLAEPIEVAQVALFLASDEASFVTGVALPVDGGWLAW